MKIQPKVAFSQQLIRADYADRVQPMVADNQKKQFSRLFNMALDEFPEAPKGRQRRGWVSKKWDVSVETARKWLVGEAIPQTSRIPVIAADINTTAAILLGMETKKTGGNNVIPIDRSKTIEIPRFEVQGSMGHGIPLPDMETIVSGIRVSATWVRTELHGVSSPSNLAIITGYGDSMEGTFRDGAQLIVDRGIKDIKVDAIYVLSLNDELYIKRLQRRPDGSILMISDNIRYPPYVIENGERTKFSVLGRVVGVWNFSKI